MKRQLYCRNPGRVFRTARRSRHHIQLITERTSESMLVLVTCNNVIMLHDNKMAKAYASMSCEN